MNGNNTTDDELRSEYDDDFFKKSVRGKYAERYAAASNVVRIAPDLTLVFPNEKAVNDALRKIMNNEKDTTKENLEPSENKSPYFYENELILAE